MKKRTKRILLIVIILIVLLNPLSFILYINAYELYRKERLWLTYKDDIYEYVYNSDKDDFFDDPSYCCMLDAVEEYDRRTNDSLKMDSLLVGLLKFRDKKGEIQCNDFLKATISHLIITRRYHLLPYVQALRDSFASYPENMFYTTQNSEGDKIQNRNIKKEIDEDISLIITYEKRKIYNRDNLKR